MSLSWHRLCGAALAFAAPAPAFAVAHTPSISGNSWVAFALIAGFIALIVIIVMASVGLQKRDAKLGRRDDGGGWFISDED